MKHHTISCFMPILVVLVFLPMCRSAKITTTIDGSNQDENDCMYDAGLSIAQNMENVTVHMDGDPRCHEDEALSNCTLDAGLSAAQQLTGPVTITIQPGNYFLHNTSCVYHNRSDIQIVGEDSPVVNCLPGTGCSFYECQNININDVTFIGCGAVHNSTSRNFPDKGYSITKYQAAIYFELCLNINITKVKVCRSNGRGLVFIASAGHISIKDSLFSDNTVTKGTAGGGGVYIEFPQCQYRKEAPCTSTDTWSSSYTSNGVYEFTRCHFINNRASHGGFSTTYHVKMTESDHYVLGNGSGLLVYFKGDASYNKISLTSCIFTENQADLGAGAFFSFSDNVLNNTIKITTTNFTNNNYHQASEIDSEQSTVSGGGLMVVFKSDANQNTISLNSCNFKGNQANFGAGAFFIFDDKSSNSAVKITTTNFTNNKCYQVNVLPKNFVDGGGAMVHFGSSSKHNKFLVRNSSFINNSAAWGGGLCIIAIGTYHNHFKTSNAEITGCYFESNIARIGAAIEFLVRLIPKKEDPLLIPVIESCIFINNGALYEYSDGSKGATFGVVNVEHMPVVFKGDTVFERNNGSALLIQSSNANFTGNAATNFTRNNGKFGAGITLLGTSWIVVNSGTQLVFSNNNATEKGGAIYARPGKEHYAAYTHTCFVRYFDSHTPPTDWNSSFIFSNNVASDQSNSIFASSILPCVWHNDGNLTDDISQTFCNWTNWNFEDGNCSNELWTSPGLYNSSDGYSMTVFPGWEAILNVTVWNDFFRSITKSTMFSASVINGSAKVAMQYDSDKGSSITVFGHPNTDVTLAVETVDDRSIYTTIDVHISLCPPGFVFNASSDSMSCVCPKSPFHDTVTCKEAKHPAELLVGYCMSYSPVEETGKNETIVTPCSFLLTSDKIMPAILLPLHVSELENKLCKNYHRRGRLCGECQDGHGISILSDTFKCITCLNTHKTWLQYIAITFILPTFIFTLIIIFHVGVTSAPANGFIFFSQVITVPLQVLFIDSALKLISEQQTGTKISSRDLTNLLLHPYRVWSLDFSSILHVDFCLKEHLRVIDALALRYVSAVQPLLLLIIAYTLIELHDRNCKIIVWLWKPCCLLCVRLRREWQAKTSIIDAFATFILLSYTKFIRVSITILTPADVFNTTGHRLHRIVLNNPTIRFFHREHAPYVALAVLILATFGALPPLLLLLYPFRRFQRCLSRCKLQSHALRAFVDAFQGCYKDGRNGGPDRRYFAGLYFIFRIAIFLMYTIAPSRLSLFTLLPIAYMLFMLMIVVLRPYKKEFYNFLDAFFFAILGATSGLTMYIYTSVLTDKVLPELSFYVAYISLFIPILYMSIYMLYWLLKKSRWFEVHCVNRLKNRFLQHSQENLLLVGGRASVCTNTTSELPDRLENPDRYDSVSIENDTFEQTRPPNEMGAVTNYKTIAAY